MQFDHERLDVYSLSRELNREVAGIIRELPPGNWESKDNLERAVKSIGRNLAEGAGKWLLADKIHFYQISRGSGTEGAASIDELVDWGLVAPERVVRAKDLLWRIVGSLTALIQKLESMPHRENAPKRRSLTPTTRSTAPARAPAPARRVPHPQPEERSGAG
ncbi:MAG TPA: four helix bundle protein [Longimicrobiales bacterium]